MTQSDARNFFDSKSFEDWKKLQEHQSKMAMAVISRCDAIIGGLNAIARSR